MLNDNLDHTYKLLLYFTSLAYLGIKIVDFGNGEEDWNVIGNTSFNDTFTSIFGKKKYSYFKFTAPEKSAMELTDTVVKDLIGERPFSTFDDLVEIAKYVLREKIGSLGFSDEELDEFKNDKLWLDFLESDVKLFAKVRKGEIWTNKDGENEVRKCTSNFSKALLGGKI